MRLAQKKIALFLNKQTKKDWLLLGKTRTQSAGAAEHAANTSFRQPQKSSAAAQHAVKVSGASAGCPCPQTSGYRTLPGAPCPPQQGFTTPVWLRGQISLQLFGQQLRFAAPRLVSAGCRTGAPHSQSGGGSPSPPMPDTAQSEGWGRPSTVTSSFPAHGPAALVYSSRDEHGTTLKFIG